MIVRTEIDGRPCSAQYLTRNRVPASEAEAEMVYVVFDDGETMFGFVDDKDDEPEAEDEFDPSEKRDEGGKWTSGGSSGAPESHGDLATSAPAREAHIDAIVKKHNMTPVALYGFDNDEYAMARAGRDSISINTDKWTPERLAQYEKEWDGMVVDHTAAGLLTHELGHAAFAQINQHHFRRAEDLAQKYYDETNGTDIFPPSPYATENSHEWAAEAFNAIHLGRVANLGSAEQQAASLAHCQKFWDEMFELRDAPPDKRRRGRANA